MVQAIVPADALQHLELAADEEVAVRVDHADVRVRGVVDAKLPAAPLLLARTEELGLREGEEEERGGREGGKDMGGEKKKVRM